MLLCCGGFGKSIDTYTGNYTLELYGSSVVDLIEALELGVPDLLGTSLGSLFAQYITVNYPSAVTHVILGDTAVMSEGLLSIPNPPNLDNVFVASQSGQAGATSPTRTYPYYLPGGLAGLCRNRNLTSYNPVDNATLAQVEQQATVQYDIEGLGGEGVSKTSILLLRRTLHYSSTACVGSAQSSRSCIRPLKQAVMAALSTLLPAMSGQGSRSR